MGSLRSRSTTPASRLALLACLALVSSFALGACTADAPAPPTTLQAPKVTQLTPKPAVVQKGIVCPVSLDEFPSNSDTNYPAKPRGSVPEGFVVEKAFICRSGTVNDNGVVKNIIQKEELQGDFALLLAALAVPSDRAEGQVACNAVLEYIPVLWLVNADGGAVDAAWPTNECLRASGKPGTQAAIDGLNVVDIRVVPGSGQGK